MDRNTFDTLFKDLVSHLYDSIILETHPLTAVLPIPTEYRDRRSEYIRMKIIQAIELLRPPVHSSNPNAPEWRSYQILYQRYVESMSPPNLATRLAISERQLRRDHSRALEALSQRLWEQLFSASEGNQLPDNLDTFEILAPDFPINSEKLDLVHIINGVLSVLDNRIHTEELMVKFNIPPSSTWTVLADRIVLRQILFSIFTYTFRKQVSQQIELNLSLQNEDVRLDINLEVGEHQQRPDIDQDSNHLEIARNWGDRMRLRVEEFSPPIGKSGQMKLTLFIPSAIQDVILVIDDQNTTLRMYQRYLSRTSLKVIGIVDPTQAIPTVRDLCPALILLDVMMPMVDGWEILQSLRSNEKTKLIPIIVCSAWEASDLARSLGAVNFLKKPITQRDLLNALRQIELITEGL